jgi:hypothetical protein
MYRKGKDGARLEGLMASTASSPRARAFRAFFAAEAVDLLETAASRGRSISESDARWRSATNGKRDRFPITDDDCRRRPAPPGSYNHALAKLMREGGLERARPCLAFMPDRRSMCWDGPSAGLSTGRIARQPQNGLPSKKMLPPPR